MRYIHLLLVLVAVTTVSFAREQKQHYDKSVFYGSEKTVLNKEAAKLSVTKAKTLFPGWSAITDRRSGTITNLHGDAVAVPGNTPVAKAAYCMSGKLKELDVMSGDWKLVRNFEAPKAQFADYEQYFNGRKVVSSRLGFRFTKDGRLTSIKIRTYGKPAVAGPVISAQDAMTSAVLTADLPGIAISSKTVAADWEWFPVPGANKYTLHPAWQVTVNASQDGSVPLKLNCYVDAIDGTLLYRTNEVKEAVDVTVKADVNVTGLAPVTLEPLANLSLAFGFSIYNTDHNGFASESSLANTAATFSLMGRWSSVVDIPSGLTPTFSQNLVGTGNNVTFLPGLYGKQHINAYYHTNKVHDHMKKYWPTFTDLDYSLTTNVDDNSGTCNAYYNGFSINFFAAGNGCNSYAEAADIVYHEYGHGINDHFYQSQSSFFYNGAMNEGYADVWGMSITQDPVTGKGSKQVAGGGSIRKYDGMPRMYPRDIQGEVHADGEIIAGAWWDVAMNWGSVDSMTQLFTATYYDLPNGLNGTEGQVYYDILIAALQNDDDDAILSNGTPHFTEIVSAFARHGIYLLGEVTFTHDEIANQSAGSPINITADILVQDLTFFQGASVYFKVRGTSTWSNVPLSNTSGITYTGQLPAQVAGDILDYYFAATTILSTDNGIFPYGYDSNPAIAAFVTLPYQFGIGLYSRERIDFENTIAGWVIGNAPGDDATSGKWIQAIPVESFADPANISGLSQPGDDHTTGSGRCLVTANATSALLPVGDADVDNGKTTVITPSFDLSMYHRPVIEYFRWYSNTRGGNAGNDAWQVQIGNSTQSNWVFVDSTFQADYSWRRRIFAVSNYLTTFSDVQLKFIASDDLINTASNQGQGVVEAAVDDFFIYDDIPNHVGSGPSVGKASIYPSPADDYITVALSTASNGTITMYDMSGKVVRATQMKGNGTKYTVDTEQLAAGHYTLMINTGSTIQSNKITISHK